MCLLNKFIQRILCHRFFTFSYFRYCATNNCDFQISVSKIRERQEEFRSRSDKMRNFNCLGVTERLIVFPLFQPDGFHLQPISEYQCDKRTSSVVTIVFKQSKAVFLGQSSIHLWRMMLAQYINSNVWSIRALIGRAMWKATSDVVASNRETATPYTIPRR